MRTKKKGTDDGTDFLYRTLCESLAGKILSGEYAPFQKLPSIRQLRAATGVSTTTVRRAIDELENRGLVEGKERSGYIVQPLRSILPIPNAPSTMEKKEPKGLSAYADSFVSSTADARLVPLGGAALGPALVPDKRLIIEMKAALYGEAKAIFRYSDPLGSQALRAQLSRRVYSQDLEFSAEDVLITLGCTDAIRIILSILCSPGDCVAVESPTFFGYLNLIQSSRLQAVEIPCHPDTGLDLSALRMAASRHTLRAVLVTPNFQNPTGALMPEDHKRELLSLATRYDFTIIESDVYSDLAHDGSRPPSIFSMSRSHVVLCGSVAKTLAPGLRVGWLVSREYGELARQRAVASYICTPQIGQEAVARLMATGSYDRHLKRLRPQLQAQVFACTKEIERSWPPGTRLSQPKGGYLLWAELRGIDGGKLYMAARQEGIAVMPGEMGSLSGQYSHYVRLNCGNPWSQTIRRAIGKLGTLIAKLE